MKRPPPSYAYHWTAGTDYLGLKLIPPFDAQIERHHLDDLAGKPFAWQIAWLSIVYVDLGFSAYDTLTWQRQARAFEEYTSRLPGGVGFEPQLVIVEVPRTRARRKP